jgi:hypothetical protein
MEVKDLIWSLQDLIWYVQSLESKVEYARYHILKHIEVFSEKEIECLIGDGILSKEDVEKVKEDKMKEEDDNI